MKMIFFLGIVFLIVGCVSAASDVNETNDIVTHELVPINQTNVTFHHESAEVNETITTLDTGDFHDDSFENDNVGENFNIKLENSKSISNDFEDNALNFTYVYDYSLNFINKSDITSSSTVNDELSEITILHSDPIYFMLENVKDGFLKVSIDGNQAGYYEFSGLLFNNLIETFISSNTVFQDYLYDLAVGNHDLMFEFDFHDEYVSVPVVYMSDSILHFDFGGDNSSNSLVSFYQFNLALNVLPKNSTVHIDCVDNFTFEDAPAVFIHFDGFKDGDIVYFGVFISNETGVVYKFDDKGEVDDDIVFSAILPYDSYEDDFEILNINLNAGKYNVTVVNFKDGTNDTSPFEILKWDIEFFELTDYLYFGVSFDCFLNIYHADDENFTVTLGEKTIKTFIDDGYNENFNVPFRDLIPGEYNVSFYYPGDRNHNGVNYNKTVKIEKQNISFYDCHEVYGDSVVIYISCNVEEFNLEEFNLDDYDILEFDFVLFVSVGDIVKEIQVNDMENLTVNFDNFAPGIYNLVVYWPGDEKFNEYRFETSVEVLPYVEVPYLNETFVNETFDDNIIVNSSLMLNISIDLVIGNNSNESVGNGDLITPNSNINNSKDDFKSKSNQKVDVEEESMLDSVGDLNSPVQSSSKCYELKKSSSKSLSKGSVVLFIIIAFIMLCFIVILYVFWDKKDFDEY